MSTKNKVMHIEVAIKEKGDRTPQAYRLVMSFDYDGNNTVYEHTIFMDEAIKLYKMLGEILLIELKTPKDGEKE